MKYNIIDTNLVQTHLLTEDDHVCGVFFNSDKHQKLLQSFRYQSDKDQNPFVSNVVDQLQEYLSGKLKKFTIPYKFVSGTEFQRKVWGVLENIPYGITKTYKQIAEAIGNPKAVRAVANAVGMNPLSIIVPCHRVVGSDGTLHGYAGGVEMKEKLLGVEGFGIIIQSGNH